MRKNLTFILVILLAITATSCGKYSGFKKGENGLYYKCHIVNKDAEMPKDGDAVIIDITMRTKDSTFFKQEAPILLDENSGIFYRGDIYPLLAMMHFGDSLTGILNADSLINMNISDILPFVDGEIYVDIKMVSMYMTKEEMDARTQEFEAEQSARELQETPDREAYLKEHNIKVQPTASGLYFIETKKGKGNQPQPGDRVLVEYTGKLLDGTVFDSSAGRQPLEISFGQHQVIPGFEEGIGMMKSGGKATIIIPSNLAYSSRGAGDIPPFSTIIFEVEIVSISANELVQ
ncbi:MAG: FKBP-type peptidyl-prolyl cis-trans isomerase [Bacteroidales bacterium]|jgi:FKBP-type peptidyl-prolyl cis-trans isomerase|nr:FKBP-type peptidyl-prolyl cis-trans isomerase [Bacteroidales bacterium]